MDVCIEDGGGWQYASLVLQQDIFIAGQTLLTKHGSILKMAMNQVMII